MTWHPRETAQAAPTASEAVLAALREQVREGVDNGRSTYLLVSEGEQAGWTQAEVDDPDSVADCAIYAANPFDDETPLPFSTDQVDALLACAHVTFRSRHGTPEQDRQRLQVPEPAIGTLTPVFEGQELSSDEAIAALIAALVEVLVRVYGEPAEALEIISW